MCTYLRGRVDGELELGLLAVVHRETFHEKGSKAGSGAATERVKDQEALKTRALVGQLADAIQDQINDLLADGVMSSSIVVGSVLLARDQLLRVVELAVVAGTNLIWKI